MNNYILLTENLTKHFEGEKKPSIENVNISLKPGRCLGVVGESGSGKSTLARVITGLVPPTEGKIFFEGENITGFSPKQYRRIYKNMQMIFQFPRESFNPARTLGESICLSLKNFKYKGDRMSEAISLLNRCGLGSDFYKKYPGDVSGGECQRAAIARALAVSPKLLICDEATSALDVIVQKRIISLLNDLKEELGMAMLFICHDISLVHNMCDDVAVMKDGVIVEYDVASRIIHHPMHSYTKTLIEASKVY